MGLSRKAREILNNSEYITYRERWFEKMEILFQSGTGRMALNGILGESSDPGRIYREPDLWVEECLENLAQKIPDVFREDRFVPPCVESALYGVHFVDRIFGSRVYFQDGQWYNQYLDSEVGELSEPDLERSETWELAVRVAEAFLAQDVKLPLFGLPTIASALNIAVNLYGEEILVAMLMEPEAARHDLRIINDTLKKIHEWYRKRIPFRQLQPVISWERTQPHGYGQLCGCTTQLLSAELYREQVMYLDDQLLAVYPNGGMIHLCGSHTHLIPCFARMEHLRSVQLNDRAAEDLEFYVKGLREDQVLYVNPCEGMKRERILELCRDRAVILAGPQAEDSFGS